ncbi:hypothetical protein [Yersinia pestis]|uniref:hypothetical protein n=1 Tax=Yersinia pestis TaxID=632 RepID=UPI00138666A5
MPFSLLSVTKCASARNFAPQIASAHGPGFDYCLCGSELRGLANNVFHDFLSCLCGSELGQTNLGDDLTFLSCLCGSEQKEFGIKVTHQFLSCLCGSELNA